MQRVFVLSSVQTPLMPCHPARARELLRKSKARVFRSVPFTIILNSREHGNLQPLELKVDPGSKKTGLALLATGKRDPKVIFAAELEHRGHAIKKALDQRRGIRRSRRHRHVRHRTPRFNNRTKPSGWLAPSLMSRVYNVQTWALRLKKLAPVSAIAVETVRFDMQAMQSPGISGVEYQQGSLQGYEVREFLLERFDRQCAYCDKKNIPLQVEHVVAKAHGGSNRISNLVLACESCNRKKGIKSLGDFLAKDQPRLKKINAQLKRPLRDAAAVNATRYAVGSALKTLGLPTSFWSGGRTKFNRMSQGFEKTHWLGAARVGSSGQKSFVPNHPGGFPFLAIKATGHGGRQLCLVDRYGFPRSKPSQARGSVHGFRTGDLVSAVVPTGKKAGHYRGRVAVRASGSFNIKTDSALVQGISSKYCKKIMGCDGYGYSQGNSVGRTRAFLPGLKAGVSCLETR